MTSAEKKQLMRWVALQTLVGAIVLGIASTLVRSVVYRKPDGDSGRDNAAATEKINRGVDVVLLGNSLLYRGVERKELTRTLADAGLKHALMWDGGSGSASWCLMARNVACAAPRPPKLVVLFFLGDEIRNPAIRATGSKWTGMRPYFRGWEPDFTRRLMLAHWREGRGTDAALTALHALWPAYAAKHGLRNILFEALTSAPGDLLGRIQPGRKWPDFSHANQTGSPRLRATPIAELAEEPTRILDQRPERFDFNAMLDESMLPLMLESCKKHGVRLAFVRLKPNPAYISAAAYKDPRLIHYFSGLRAWCAANDIACLDLSDDADLTPGCFHTDDHMNSIGRTVLTPKITGWLLEQLRVGTPSSSPSADK